MGNLQKYKARPYQKECLTKIAEVVNNGEKRALVVMASGLGKTITAAMAVEQFFANQPSFGHVLILCHSEQILSQSKDKFKDYFGEEYSYGLYAGKDKTTRQTDFLFATFQTMKEHRKEFAKDAFVYIVVDEAHHSHAHTYFPTIKYFKPEFLLGLTATPDRLDGQNIEEIYGAPVYELNFIEAMSQGLLTECDYQLVLDDMSQEKLNECLESGERLSITQLNRTVFVPKRDEEIVRLIKEYSAEQKDPKTIIFCKTIEHARHITKMMSEDAVLVHNGQSKLTNDMALEAFRQGKTHAIVSVQMLNEGIDVPDANVIVFLRNTISETIFYQQLGRGTRLSPGKDKVKVLDFVANCERIQAVLELKRDFDDFKLQQPVTDAKPHGAGDADSREKFTLNIATPEFQIKMVNIIEILDSVRQRWNGTKEEVLEGLRLMYQRGEKVTAEAIDQNPNLPHSTTIMSMFGGRLNNALREAGLPINQQDRVCIDKDSMIAEGKNMLSRNEKITYKSVSKNPNLPHVTTVTKTFGSIADFALVCGQSTTAKDFSREGMLKAYWERSRAAKHWLSLTEIDRDKTLTYAKKYKCEFGGIEPLIKAAQEIYGPILTDDEQRKLNEKKEENIRQKLAKDFYEASMRKGRWLMKKEFNKKNGVSSLARYWRYFPEGSIKSLIEYTRKQYGDLPEENTTYQQTQYKDDEELIKEYYQESKASGHWQTSDEVDNNPRLASSVTYHNRFGGMRPTRKLAIETYGDFTKNN